MLWDLKPGGWVESVLLEFEANSLCEEYLQTAAIFFGWYGEDVGAVFGLGVGPMEIYPLQLPELVFWWLFFSF